MVDFAAVDTTQESVIDLIARTIVDRLHPRRVILIGSRARGDARPDSDYDIVVEFDPDARTEIDLVGEVMAQLVGVHRPIDVIARRTGEIERRAETGGAET